MPELARAGLLLSLGVFVENRAFGSQRSADYLSVVRPRSRATAGGLFLLDYGTFYASKSFEIPNSGDSGWPLLGSARRGRRILWGWADETDTCGPWPACTKPGEHNGSLTTLLAVLHVHSDGALRQRRVRGRRFGRAHGVGCRLSLATSLMTR